MSYRFRVPAWSERFRFAWLILTGQFVTATGEVDPESFTVSRPTPPTDRREEGR